MGFLEKNLDQTPAGAAVSDFKHDDDMSEDKFELYRESCIKGEQQRKRLASIRATLRVNRETKQKLEMAKYVMQKGNRSSGKTQLLEGKYLCIKKNNPERFPQT